MRYVLICLLVVNFYNSYGQLLCEEVSSTDLIGDYPPGCNLCFATDNRTNMGYTPDDTISYDFPCGEVENSIWYSFDSRGNGNISLRIVTSDCTMGKGLEVAIFDEDLNRVSDCVFVDPQTNKGIFIRDTILQQYHLMIDGIDGDLCEYRITNNSVSGLRSDRIYVDPPDANYCVGTEVCFEIGRDLALETYEWSVPTTDSIISGGIDENKIRLYLKTAGTKDIALNVFDECIEKDFIQTLEVNEGPLFSIDSFTAIFDKPCLDEEIRFEVNWDNDSILLDWDIPTSHFQRIDGGFLSSDFYVGKILNSGDVTVSVTPLDHCGIRNELNLTTGRPRSEVLIGSVCPSGCFTIEDSCYFIGSSREIIPVAPTFLGCDSTVFLILEEVEVFPSPNIECALLSDSVFVEWEQHSSVDSTIIFVNRDSIGITSDNFYWIENVPSSLLFDIKIQPLGDCSYLPAEIKCPGLVNTTSNFLNNKISVFPNPTTAEINIKTVLKIESVEVFDLAGRLLQKEKTTSFELKSRAPGIYFLKIKTNEGVGVKRVVVN